MSRKKKTPPARPRKRQPMALENDGGFAQFFEEIATSMFEKAGYFPEPAKVIDLQQWRKDKESKD